MKGKKRLKSKEEKWIEELKELLNNKPRQIEVIVCENKIAICSLGTFQKRLKVFYEGWGDPDIDNTNILCILANNKKLLPYSED